MRNIGFIIGFCIMGVLLAACSKEKRRVLVIHSYETDYPGYEEYNNLLEAEFAKANMPVDIVYFYLDCERRNESQEIKFITELLDSVAGWKPEVILVNDDQATYSLLKTYHPLAKKTPIVFTGVNYPNWELLAEYTNVTGFRDKIDFGKNLQMIAGLTKRLGIYTILDYTFLDRKIREDIDQQLVSPEIISNLDWKLTKKEVRAEQRKGNIIFSAFSVRRPSKNWGNDNTVGADFLWAISKFSTMPYLQTKYDYIAVTMASFSTRLRFTAINELFNCGYNFLGGYMTPVSTQVKEGVEAVTRILKGADVSQMPVRESSKGYYIDWNVLQKEGMKLQDLPVEYTVINIPYKVSHPFLWWSALLGGMLTVVFLLVVLAYLYWRETQRKRSVLYDLEDEKESLALAVEGSNTYAWRLKGDAMVFENVFWKNLDKESRPLRVTEFLSFVHPDYLQEAQSLIDQMTTNGKYFMELKCDFTGNGYEWWELRCSTMKSAFGGQKTTGLLLNIEEFKKREQELIEARELAEKAELKESFLANMSHEIRTPLNAIVGFSDLLSSPEMEFSKEEKEQFRETISRNNELLLKLINDILEISRIESGYMSFNYGHYPLASLMNEIYLTHRLLIPHHLDFRLQKGDEDIMVYVDRDRLVQVLTNFLNNAAKFTKEGSIELGWSCLPGSQEVEIYVEDTGIGIPKSEQKMIFSRFYKQNEFAQGTGLGLSICKVIVEKLQGRIALSSEVGVGSRFSVFFSCEKRS